MRGRKIIAGLLSVMLVLAAVFAGNVTNAKADEPTYYSVLLAGTVNDHIVTYNVGGKAVTLTVPNEIHIDMENGKTISVTESVEFTIGNTFDSNSMEVKVSEVGGFSTTLAVDSNNKTSLYARANQGTGGLPSESTLTLEIVSKSNNDPESGEPSGDVHYNNGEDVYLFWKGTSGVDYHKFTTASDTSKNIQYGGPSEGTYYLNKIEAVDIVADNNSSDKYADAFRSQIYWVPASVFTDSEKGWSTGDSPLKSLFNGTLTEADYHAVTLNPGTSEYGTGSVVTTPDMAFRVSIISSEYQSIKTAAYPTYPNSPFNSSVFEMPEIDITGATQNNPAIYKVFLEEPSVTFESGTATQITNVEVIGDAANGGIVVSSPSTGRYKLEFKSNYYDSILIKVTEGTTSYYVKVVRTALQARDNFGPGVTDPKITMSYTYPQTMGNHGSFNVFAKIMYANGTTQLKKADSVQVEDDMNPGNYLGYDFDIGGSLHKSEYAVSLDSLDVIGVYFTVVSSTVDLTDSTKTSFSGMKSGSGLGVYYDVVNRKVVY
ncbi:MAG: hypothetical protein PUC12_03320 [Clostridiales bacterium]|nr:hypothetical protein [Clostridiales bacterium]